MKAPSAADNKVLRPGNRFIVSVHVPKTGGTTFKNLLGDPRVGHTFFDYDERPLSLPATKRPLSRVRTHLRMLAIKKMLDKPGTDRVFVHGHFLAEKYRSLWPDTGWITWFRDPVERLVSHYYHWQRSPDHKNAACRKLHRLGLDIVGFSQLPEMRNVHARFLGPIQPQQLAFVGVTEEYERSLQLFARRCGVPLDSVSKTEVHNRNPDKTRARYSLTSQVRSEIEAANATDLKLYEQAKRRFDQLWKTVADESSSNGEPIDFDTGQFAY